MQIGFLYIGEEGGRKSYRDALTFQNRDSVEKKRKEGRKEEKIEKRNLSVERKFRDREMFSRESTKEKSGAKLKKRRRRKKRKKNVQPSADVPPFN